MRNNKKTSSPIINVLPEYKNINASKNAYRNRIVCYYQL